MPLLRDVLRDAGIGADEAAERLNQAGVRVQSPDGPRPVTKRDIHNRKQAPKRWLEELSGASPISSPDGDGAGDAHGQRETSSPSRERPPKPPPDAKIAPLEVADRAGAKKRIEWAYSFIGTGLAAGSGYEGVAVVWTDQAPTLAELWLKAAEENPWAARVVQAAEAGGPVGDLVGAHVYLMAATAYVAGAALPGGDSIFAKYSRYRPVERVDEVAQRRAEEAARDGAGAHEGAAHVVE